MASHPRKSSGSSDRALPPRQVAGPSNPPPPPPPPPQQQQQQMINASQFSSETPIPCGQTITIPPELPDILKQYAKGAMRTQPPDLLRWSGAYFRAVANGEKPPVKDRVEHPLRESKDGLSPGILRIINSQLGAKAGQKVAVDQILKRWRGFGLSVQAFNDVLARAGMAGAQVVEWDKLVAVMAATIGQNLYETMSILCEVWTEQQEGADPVMNYGQWLAMYTYLGINILGVINQTHVQTMEACLAPLAKNHGGMIGPNDFNTTCRPN